MYASLTFIDIREKRLEMLKFFISIRDVRIVVVTHVNSTVVTILLYLIDISY